MSGNLGATRLKKRRRKGDPMEAFDALPPELRTWLTKAALPWSPRSCAKIWTRAAQEGLAPADRIERLEACELRALERDETRNGTYAREVGFSS